MKNNIYLLSLLMAVMIASCNNPFSNRQTVSLNGQWDLTVSDSPETLPSAFNCKVPVPGLVDMATIKFDSIGLNRQNRYFWYRTNFSLSGPYPDKVILKINKARYGTWIFVNGNLSGKNDYCFTPTFIDIKKYLKEPGKENELIIAVGSYYSLPDTIINGWDFEKTRYIPGIYDDVKLILADYPFDFSKDSIEPVYEELPGWNSSLEQITSFNELPVEFSAYIRYIEKAVNLPVDIVSTGPDRLQTLKR